MYSHMRLEIWGLSACRNKIFLMPSLNKYIMRQTQPLFQVQLHNTLSNDNELCSWNELFCKSITIFDQLCKRTAGNCNYSQDQKGYRNEYTCILAHILHHHLDLSVETCVLC